MSPPSVLIVGATGHTGRSIVNALLKNGGFKVAAAVRPSSLGKPAVEEIRAAGVEIREADITIDDAAKLKTVLAGVDVLISTVDWHLIEKQKAILSAAKEAGVKRVIPCDFGTPGARGVRVLHDAKLDIRDFIRELGVGYTFIDVGWWMQLSLPCGLASKSPMAPMSRDYLADGKAKLIVTDYHHIGEYVARIIADERTLNQYVIVWEDEVTHEQAKEIGERVSGDGEALREKRVPVSAEEINQRVVSLKEEWVRTKSAQAEFGLLSSEYQLSIHVLGENTLENAKKLGALDARELYPDIIPTPLAEYAKKFYTGDDIL